MSMPNPSDKALSWSNEYPNRGPVLVDEAHNFRNINKRYVGLSSYLDSGDHKVVLLSATPQNLGPRDIYRQLRLFLDETEHGLNIEPVGLEDFFRCAEIWHKYRAEHENYNRGPPRMGVGYSGNGASDCPQSAECAQGGHRAGSDACVHPPAPKGHNRDSMTPRPSEAVPSGSRNPSCPTWPIASTRCTPRRGPLRSWSLCSSVTRRRGTESPTT